MSLATVPRKCIGTKVEFASALSIVISARIWRNRGLDERIDVGGNEIVRKSGECGRVSRHVGYTSQVRYLFYALGLIVRSNLTC